MNSETRKQTLESFGTAPQQLESSLKSIEAKIWDWVPAPAEWSIRQIVFHITDSEANYYIRLRKAIAEPGGMVVAFDQNLWTDSLAYPARNIEDDLRLFRLLRVSSYQLLAQLPEAKWTNWVLHSERGKLLLDDLLGVAERHVIEHLKQIEDNVKKYKTH